MGKRGKPGGDGAKLRSGLCKAEALSRFRSLLELHRRWAAAEAAAGCNVHTSGSRTPACVAQPGAADAEAAEELAAVAGRMAYGELKAAAGGGAYAGAWRRLRGEAGGRFERWIDKPPRLERFGAGKVT